MKYRILYLLIFFSCTSFKNYNVAVTRWVVVGGCSLKVDGSTNVNNFSCAISNYSKPDTILVSKNNQPVQLNGSLRLDVENFDCRNPIMTADLRKTLKVKEFPHLVIRFISMNKYPEPGASQNTKGMVLIDLAGVSKIFEVDYKIVSADNSFISLVGSRKVNFSDFKITPPRKLGGMIRTNDELSVVFNLRMKVVN